MTVVVVPLLLMLVVCLNTEGGRVDGYQNGLRDGMDGWQIGRRLVVWIMKGRMDRRLTWVEGVDGHGMGWMDRLIG